MSGNSKMGSSAVNGMGMASVIQNTTISTVTASTRWPTSVNPSGVGMKPMISISRIPTIKPIFWTFVLPMDSPPLLRCSFPAKSVEIYKKCLC